MGFAGTLTIKIPYNFTYHVFWSYWKPACWVIISTYFKAKKDALYIQLQKNPKSLWSSRKTLNPYDHQEDFMKDGKAAPTNKVEH
jgi:hypothetical protein